MNRILNAMLFICGLIVYTISAELFHYLATNYTEHEFIITSIMFLVHVLCTFTALSSIGVMVFALVGIVVGCHPFK